MWGALAGVGSLLLLLAGALGLLLYHPDAPRWALDLAREFSPLEIEADRIEGRLAGPLAIEGLRLRDGRFSLRIGEVGFDWRPAALLQGELHLRDLSVRELALTLPEQKAPSEAGGESAPAMEFKGVTLPLAVRLDHLELENLAIQRPGAETLSIERIGLAAETREQRLELQRLEFAMPGLSLQAKGWLGLTASLPLALELDWRFTPPQQEALQGAGTLAGDLERLEVGQSLSGLLSADLQASVSDPLGDLSWDARVDVAETGLEAWLDGYPLRAGGRLRSRGTPARIGLEAELALSQSELGAADLSLNGEYAGGRLQVERLQLTTPAGSRLTGRGGYEPGEAGGRFDGSLAWTSLRWPLQGGTPQVQSPQGRLQLKGSPDAYDYTLAADLKVPGQPATHVDARGRGDRRGLRLETLAAMADPARLDARGELVWSPALSWQLQLDGREIDPSLWVAGLTGRLQLAARTQGRIEGRAVTGEVRLERLQGRLRDYPVSAQGEAKLADEVLTLDGLSLTSGDNRVEVSGRIAQTLALDWRIDAPSLEAFWPGLEGSLRGAGRLQGTAKTPRVVAELQGEGVAFQDNRTGRLQLKGELDLAGDQTLALDLQAEELRLAAGHWQRLAVQLDGTLPDHRLNLELSGEEFPGLRLQSDAGWAGDGAWTGRLQSLELTMPQRPVWRLKAPAAYALAADSQRLDRICLDNGEAVLCGDFEQSTAQGWRAGLDSQDFPLAMLQQWLPEGLRLDGRSDIEVHLAAASGAAPQGAWRLRLPQGRIGLDLENEAEFIDFSGGEVAGEIDPQGAGMKLNLPMAGMGRIDGEMGLPGFDPLDPRPAQQPLKGRLNLELTDLSRLSLISPRLQNPRGGIHGDFELAGTLEQPQLLGNAQLREGALDIPELGLELRDIALQLEAPELDRVTLQGGLRSGDGRLQLTGELELDAQAGFPARLQITGKELTVADVPEAEVLVSPDLNLERDRTGTRLKGRIEIPYARLRPRRLPSSAVTASPDLVVVGEQESEAKPFDSHLTAELRVELGNRVSFDGFGLRGKFTGSLLVIDEPKRPVIGRGRIGIAEGTYRAYGQDLSIERGFALFADSPIDNPGLDVRAVREVEEVTVGVRVGGTLKAPKVDLFSSPAMGESDTLSYLLTGRPAGEGGGESLGVVAALKATGAGTVAEELGRQFGLEELRLDTGSTLEQASVVAGTYLNPRLYVQYINELASRETKLRMRYDINKRLQLEAETGKTQAGDLYYTFDR